MTGYQTGTAYYGAKQISASVSGSDMYGRCAVVTAQNLFYKELEQESAWFKSSISYKGSVQFLRESH